MVLLLGVVWCGGGNRGFVGMKGLVSGWEMIDSGVGIGEFGPDTA